MFSSVMSQIRQLPFRNGVAGDYVLPGPSLHWKPGADMLGPRESARQVWPVLGAPGAGQAVWVGPLLPVPHWVPGVGLNQVLLKALSLAHSLATAPRAAGAAAWEGHPD